MDADRLNAAFSYAASHHSRGVVVMREGVIVAERYWQGWAPDSSAVIHSATKGVVAILIGMCLHDGHITSLDQSAADFFPVWKDQPQHAITIRHLLTMTSGLHSPPLLSMRPGAVKDEHTLGLNLKLMQRPGSAWEYNTAAFRLLYSVIEIASGTNLDEYTRRRLLEPLGAQHTHWRSRQHNGTEIFLNLVCSALDMALIGQLVAQYGQWNGRQLLHPSYVEAALRPSLRFKPVYGYAFWLNPNKRLLPDCPADTVMSIGAQDVRIFVIPSLQLVVTRLGELAIPRDDPRRRRAHNADNFDNVLLRGFCSALEVQESSPLGLAQAVY